MGRRCDACETDNPDEARFCFACGSGMTQRGVERKFVTALFADIVGSTSLGEREDPEVVSAIINRAFERMMAHVQGFGGSLERFMGDGLLAVFGAPITHEDDPERALRAGLAMLEDIGALADELLDEHRPPVEIRIGVEAGDVLVDLDRLSTTHDRMLTGDAVNVAARLQAVADPGHLVCGPIAHGLSRHAFVFRSLGDVSLKGKAEPVRAWDCSGVVPETRADVPLTRLIGRDTDLTLLDAAHRRSVTDGRPVLISVIGDAGVGKSRLVAEWSRSLTGVSVHVGRSSAFGDRSYAALVTIVRETASRANDRSGPDALTSLVGSDDSSATSRDDLFEASRAFVEALARERPTVLIFEDAHWADEGLLELIEHVARWSDGPLTLVVVARATLLEHRPGWGNRARDAVIVRLDALSPTATGELVEAQLGATASDELVQTILSRAGGNPLFVEEIVRMLHDRGMLVRSGDRWSLADVAAVSHVPRSVHGLLAARLDALTTEEKRTIQLAAVIGSTFEPAAVDELTGGASPRSAIEALRAKGLLLPDEGDDDTWSFRHVLIRDVAYEALPKRERARAHLDLAAWLRTRTPAAPAESIATHLVSGLRYLDELGEPPPDGLETQTCRAAAGAGRRAAALWQPAAAVAWFRAALDLVPRADVDADEEAAMWEAYGRVGEGAQPYATVANALERARQLYDGAGRSDAAARVEAWLAWAAYQSGREDDVVPLAKRAIDRLEPFGDTADLAMALRILGRYQRRRGDAGDAEVTLRRAMEIAERVGDDVSRAWAMITIGPMLRADGGVRGMRLAEQGLELAKRTGDLALILQAHVDVSEGYEEIIGDYARAEALMREGLAIAERAGSGANISWLEGNLADYLVDQGRLDEALVPAGRALALAREVGERARIAYCLSTIAYIDVLHVAVEEAAAALQEAQAIEEAVPDTWIGGWLPLVGSLIARARGRDEEAVAIAVDGATRLADRAEVWGGVPLQLECVRGLALAGRFAETVAFRDRLDRLASFSVAARAFLAWADALVEQDLAKRVQLFGDALDRLDDIGRAVDLGRCLLDAASAAEAAGEDGAAWATRGRRLLRETGAVLFLDRSASSDADARSRTR